MGKINFGSDHQSADRGGGPGAGVTDINPAGNSFPFGFTEFADALYFSANDGTTGSELRRVEADGNVVQVADINPAGNSIPFGFTEFDPGDII